MTEALTFAEVWADGIHGEYRTNATATPTAVFRLHRDGASALGREMGRNVLHRLAIARSLNAQLIALCHIWKMLATRTPIELRIQLLNLGETAVNLMNLFDERKSLVSPAGVPVDSVSARREVLLADIDRASSRHTIVRDFHRRLHNAYGLQSAATMFAEGWLHGADGEPLRLSLVGRSIWNMEGRAEAYVYEGGLIENAANDTVIAGYAVDGAIIDEQGRTMAVVELASGAGVPSGFIPRNLHADPRPKVQGGSHPGPPHPTNREFQLPEPVGEWSDVQLADRFKPDAK